MTGIPDYLLDSPHLPLVLGQTNVPVLALLKQFYGLVLNPEDYKVSQVFRGSDGLLHFDLLDKDGNLLTSFVDKTSGTGIVKIANQTPTLSLTDVAVDNWLAKEVRIYDKLQLALFDNYNQGFIYDAMESMSDIGYQLSLLLNRYTDKPVWAHSSFAENSTAKFGLVYKGSVSDAPEDLGLPNIQAYAVLVNILSGKHKGLICFLVPY